MGCQRKWRNWQTRRPQEPVGETPWEFKSPLPHQCRRASCRDLSPSRRLAASRARPGDSTMTVTRRTLGWSRSRSSSRRGSSRRSQPPNRRSGTITRRRSPRSKPPCPDSRRRKPRRWPRASRKRTGRSTCSGIPPGSRCRRGGRRSPSSSKPDTRDALRAGDSHAPGSSRSADLRPEARALEGTPDGPRTAL